MDSQTFEDLVNRQIDRSRNMLISKGEEYATADRLHNFRVAAKLQNTTMHQALSGMMAKHTASVYDMLQDDIGAHDFDKWNEKITDHINYLLILQAVLDDEREAGYAPTVNQLLREDFINPDNTPANPHKKGI